MKGVRERERNFTNMHHLPPIPIPYSTPNYVLLKPKTETVYSSRGTCKPKHAGILTKFKEHCIFGEGEDEGAPRPPQC